MVVKLTLSKIITRYDKRKLVFRKGREDYWSNLENSLVKEGLNSDKYSLVQAYKSFFHKGKYELMDGNHRVYILKKLYPEEKEIKVKMISRLDVILVYLKTPFLFIREMLKR